jgi:hypothetical protein
MYYTVSILKNSQDRSRSFRWLSVREHRKEGESIGRWILLVRQDSQRTGSRLNYRPLGVSDYVRGCQLCFRSITGNPFFVNRLRQLPLLFWIFSQRSIFRSREVVCFFPPVPQDVREKSSCSVNIIRASQSAASDRHIDVSTVVLSVPYLNLLHRELCCL